MEVASRRVELTTKWNGLLTQLSDREAALKAALEGKASSLSIFVRPYLFARLRLSLFARIPLPLFSLKK